MIVSNKKRAVSFRRLFFLVSLLMAVTALVLFLTDLTLYALITVGVFAIWFLYFQVADYRFIDYSDENNKIIVRYYKLVKFGKTEYSAIEFPKNLLYRATFENSVFGKMTDLTLVIKTRRGLAEYPPVSLTALKKEERMQIKGSLYNIMGI